MIRLTSAQTGNPIFVNPEKISFITRSKMFGGEKNETLLTSENGEKFVTEFPAEVARKVLAWRLVMERYRAYVNAAASEEKPQANECWELAANARAELARLAGLENIEEYKRAKEDDGHE